MSRLTIRGDFFGGVTAAIVALPLGLAFGVSSGIGAVAGIYGAILVGFFAALFGGTPVQISGPTGPMTVVMATILITYNQAYGDSGLAMAFTVVVMAGVVQILFGLFRLGKYITLVPYTVISGFMSGIGVIIIILQLGPLCGYESGSDILLTMGSIPGYFSRPDLPSLVLGLGTVLLLRYWPSRFGLILPGPVVALVLGTVIAYLAWPGGSLVRIGEIPFGLPALHYPAFHMDALKDMVYSAVLLAGLGAIDSLLTSMVADSITGQQHNSDRELIGQGIGNMVAGLFGAIPGAGATMRTVINVHSGGSTQLSGMIHSVILLIIILCAGPLAEQIPHCILAGILIKVGLDIIDWRFLKRIHRLPLSSSMMTVTILLLTVFVDLITAVLIGAFVANMVTLERLTNVQLDGIRFSTAGAVSGRLRPREKLILERAKGKILLFELEGPVSFGVARRINRLLSGYKEHRILIIEMNRAVMVGMTTSMVLEDAIIKEQRAGRLVYLSGINESIDKSFKRLDIYKHVPEELRFSDCYVALRHAASQVKQKVKKVRSTELTVHTG